MARRRRFTGKNFLEINEDWKSEFQSRINVENLKVIYITSIVGLGFLFLLLYLDFLRYQSGKLLHEPIYRVLFVNHLLFSLFAIPVAVITRHRRVIRLGQYRHAKTLTYLWITICGVILLMMSILGLWDRGSMFLYVIYIFLLNFVIVMPHLARVIFNLTSFLVILVAVIINYENDQEMLIIKTMEALGVTAPAFIVSTYRFNTFVKQLSSEKLLASKNEAIAEAKKRSEDLLLNILPFSIAEELKEKGKVTPKYYDSVSIMFIDIIGFTVITKESTPNKLVENLDHCFTGFDRIAERYQIEKIKTMGDAYICVAGFVVKEDHAIRMIKAAQEMLAFAERWNKEKEEKGELPFHIRIGIHTGSIVAGVVGLNKFAFDIWGDAVNIAARLEASGEKSKINVSGNTYQLIKEHFSCTPRGKIAIKNAGELEMYFVEGEH